MSDEKEARGTFNFDGDTKRMHRFQVKALGDIVGTIYIPQDCDGIPNRIILDYQKPVVPKH